MKESKEEKARLEKEALIKEKIIASPLLTLCDDWIWF